jgi:hypothetical protein
MRGDNGEAAAAGAQVQNIADPFRLGDPRAELRNNSSAMNERGTMTRSST